MSPKLIFGAIGSNRRKPKCRRRYPGRKSSLGVAAGLILASSLTTSDATMANSQVFEEEGVRIELSVVPLDGSGDVRVEETDRLLEAEYAEVRFRITDRQSGRPISGLYPAAWMDLASTADSAEANALSCSHKIRRYAQGSLSFRPLLDLNSYQVLTLNHDPSISVLDPIVNVGGLTSTFTRMPLQSPGADWTQARSLHRLFVSMPRDGQVAVFDTTDFSLIANLDIGGRPVRMVMEPEEQRLWVGNDTHASGGGGVSVLDTQSLEVLARLPTGNGHHDIVIDPGLARAFVTNSLDGTVSLIDVDKLTEIAVVKAGADPVSVAYSTLGEAAYVGSLDGTLTIIDPEQGRVIERLSLAPGLRMVRFTPDGRWAFLVNTEANTVEILDPATQQIRHTLEVPAGPDQVTFTPAFAYVRSLGSTSISMIALEGLANSKLPAVLNFAAGQAEPGHASRVGLDQAIATTNIDHAVLVTNPTSDFIFYYMEGMGAPMGSFRNLGHYATSLAIVDRSLQERSPGLYTTQIRPPTHGVYNLALLLDSPRLTHCFTVNIAENPKLAASRKPRYTVTFDERPERAELGSRVPVRFRLQQTRGRETTTVSDEAVNLNIIGASGHYRRRVLARPTAEGGYEATVHLRYPGAWYLFVEAPALGITTKDLRPTVIRVDPPHLDAGKPEARPRPIARRSQEE